MPNSVGYRLNCLDEPVLMAVPKPMQTEFDIHYRLESYDTHFSLCIAMKEPKIVFGTKRSNGKVCMWGRGHNINIEYITRYGHSTVILYTTQLISVPPICVVYGAAPSSLSPKIKLKAVTVRALKTKKYEYVCFLVCGF